MQGDVNSDGQAGFEGYPVSRSVSRSMGQLAGQLAGQSSIPALTPAQSKVLIYLIAQGGITQRDAISAATDVPLGTVKHSLIQLVKHGFISKPQYYVKAAFRGISYRINLQPCYDFLCLHGGENGPQGDLTGQPTGQPDVSTYSSSKSFKDFSTTRKPDLWKTLDDPELGYWREVGLTEKQVLSWMGEMGLSVEVMDLCLRYARWDILFENKSIEKPLSFFYSVIKKNGFYAKPDGYRSLEQIRLEAVREAIQDRERVVAELQEARERKRQADHELRFQQMLADPLGPEYQSLFQGLNGFARGLKGKALEGALRGVFNETVDCQEG